MSAIPTRLAGLLVLLAAWAVVLHGLFRLPASNDPVLDLEAGPAFGINLTVYLPALAMCMVLLVALPVSVVARRGALVGAGASLAVCAFALWVLTHDELLDYLPGLGVTLGWAIGLGSASLVLYGAGGGEGGIRGERSRRRSRCATRVVSF